MTSKEKPDNFDQPMRVAGIIVRVEDEVLYLKRALYKKFGAGQWALPVGKIEDEESFVKGALRELEEEVGICLGQDELKYINTYYHSPKRDSSVQLEYVTFEARKESKPDIILNKESEDYKWCHVDEVLALDLTDGEDFCFQDYLLSRK